jgi:hypothetical protein
MCWPRNSGGGLVWWEAMVRGSSGMWEGEMWDGISSRWVVYSCENSRRE